jgi:hypothetical protein
MNLLIMLFSPDSSYLLLLGPKCILSTKFSYVISLCSFLIVRRLQTVLTISFRKDGLCNVHAHLISHTSTMLGLTPSIPELFLS